MNMDIPIFPDGTKREDAINELIDDENFKETVLKQFNYMRIKGINLPTFFISVFHIMFHSSV